MPTPSQSFDIPLPLVQKLIQTQFPAFASLAIQPVMVQGHDNRTFRLGTDLLVRLPTAHAYALKVPKEQQILPFLAKHLTVPIPTPVAMGMPTPDYPFNFSIYRWIEGESASTLQLDEQAMVGIAHDLATFLEELHQIDSAGGPPPGLHNWYRGAHVSVYDEQMREQAAALQGVIDTDAALALWQAACATAWHHPPVWIHGDLASGNVLIRNQRLAGIIDFGGTGVGDPACDLTIVWTFLRDKAREIFIEKVSLDGATWLRAKAWALWKATFQLCQIEDKKSLPAQVQQKIIQDVLAAGE